MQPSTPSHSQSGNHAGRREFSSHRAHNARYEYSRCVLCVLCVRKLRAIVIQSVGWWAGSVLCCARSELCEMQFTSPNAHHARYG